MRKARALVVAAVVLLAPAAAHSQAQPAPSAFEHVHALAFDAAGRTLWLGAHAGLFRSEDGGRTWTKAPLGAQSHAPDVMAIAPHPTEAGVLYVGTHAAGVLKSSDSGRTWEARNSGLRGLDVHGLAADAGMRDRLYALVREAGAGLWRTADAGRTWVRVDDGPQGETKVLTSVKIPTGMGGIFLYAGTGEGLRKSPDCF